MSAFVNLTGLHFGMWHVMRAARDRKHWVCRCACGTTRYVAGRNLRSGNSTSCGCYRPNQTGGSPAGPNHPTTKAKRAEYGEHYVPASSYWYKKASSARQRAIHNGVPFGFATIMECARHLASIAPLRCPVFGMKLTTENRTAFEPSAASADRMVPSRGYVPGNLQVISMMANRMKCDATKEQLQAFALWVLTESDQWI